MGVQGWPEDSMPWNYTGKIKDFLKPGVRVLNIGADGSELLLSLGHPYELTSLTVEREQDWLLCQKRLLPLGIVVKQMEMEEALPFPDRVFDLVLNRHQPLDLKETARVLRPGGFFVTQQVGGMDSKGMPWWREPSRQKPGLNFNLENQLPEFRRAGFRVSYCHQAYLAAGSGKIGERQHRFIVVGKKV